MIQKLLIAIIAFGLMLTASVSAFPVNLTSAGCIWDGTDNAGVVSDLTIQCGDTTLEYTEDVDTSILGTVLDGEVAITSSSVYVDAIARPDLDKKATLTFQAPFVEEPNVLRNGVACTNTCNGTSWDARTQIFSVDVLSFSNYSLTSKKEFIVNSDPEPELSDKTYQTIDLGDSYRSDDFACIVQIYGRNDAGQFILVQTNPERKSQGLIVSPDANLPESLGYFKPVHGIANVYFNGATLSGYNEFEYVAQCANNATKLTYEESISTRYKAAGRGFQGRLLWFIDGGNAGYIVIISVVAFICLFLGIKLVRVARGK